MDRLRKQSLVLLGGAAVVLLAAADDVLAPDFYTVRFHLKRPDGGAAKTYRAEGTLQLLQYGDAAPRVHTITVNDRNLFHYIQQREMLWAVPPRR